MTDEFHISDQKIQEYIDGRLSEGDQAAFAAYLLSNPDKAVEIQELRQQNEALKGLGAEVLSEPVPERLKEVMRVANNLTNEKNTRAAYRRGIAQTAAAVMVFVFGILAGWFGHGYLRPGPDQNTVALLSARDAYMLYAGQVDYPVGFPPDKESELTGLFEKLFKRQIMPPPLDKLGYQYVGGSVLPWSGGQQGMFLFQDDNSKRVAIVVWPSGNPPRGNIQLAGNENLKYRFWWNDGFGYAVLGDRVNENLDDLAKSVTTFYTAKN